MSISLSCATAPTLPVQGGGGAMPTQVPVQGGGPLPAMPMAPATTTTTTMPAVPTASVASAPASLSPAALLAGPPSGGAPVSVEALNASLTNVAAASSGAGVPAPGTVTGGGPVACPPPCSSGPVQAWNGAKQRSKRGGRAKGAKGAPGAGSAKGGSLDSKGLEVKGQKMSSAQRKNLEAVLKQGQKMGANKKVLEAAVATVIQESNAENLNGGDRDSIGLFQQRPSMGWGSPEQVGNPKYAAKKFFEKAIAADKKDPGMAKTALAQSVQRSAFPDAYAQWDKEAERIVADYLG